MVWASSNRGASLPNNWGEIRGRVIARDQGVCQWPLPFGGKCGNQANEVDHKDDPADHRLGNLWLLCHDHHARKTQIEARNARGRLESKRIDRYSHPNATT
jgi:5-methylcytosine-specific restriction protein A